MQDTDLFWAICLYALRYCTPDSTSNIHENIFFFLKPQLTIVVTWNHTSIYLILMCQPESVVGAIICTRSTRNLLEFNKCNMLHCTADYWCVKWLNKNDLTIGVCIFFFSIWQSLSMNICIFQRVPEELRVPHYHLAGASPGAYLCSNRTRPGLAGTIYCIKIIIKYYRV